MPIQTKHRQIFEKLYAAIVTDEYEVGEKLPSEAELAAEFRVSRPTVAEAMNELERLGLVDRHVGSGTYVKPRLGARRFGLLIPEVEETEIFGPIARQIARELQKAQHSLLWGESTERDAAGVREQTEQLCRKYIEQKVSGVFFAPLELAPEQDMVNRTVVEKFERAGIPVILLDRDTTPYPERSQHDLVSIDHRRGGFVLARHLLQLGLDRIDFLARPLSAPSVTMRIAGYQEALLQAGIVPQRSWIHMGDPEDLSFVRQVAQQRRARALICANDVTAAHLMQSLNALGYRVPEDIRVTGFDDIKYARLLRVPLTTVRQPCEVLGTLAVQAIYERIQRPNLPPREILITAALVVRTSCGAGQDAQQGGSPDAAYVVRAG